MKFTFVSLFSYPLFNAQSRVIFGGSEVQLQNISKELSKNSNNKINFIVGDYSPAYSKELIDGISVYKIFNLSKNKFVFKIIDAIRLFFYLKSIDSDIFIKRAAGPEAGIIALFCKIFNKKFVFMTAHEVDCSGEYKRKNWLLGSLYEFGLKNADLVITQSEEHKKLLEKNYDIDAAVLKSGYVIPEKNIEQKLDFILWVARLEDWKRPELFVEIAKKIPDEKFVMIAPDSSDKAYTEKIKKNALENKIKLISGLPFAEMDEYFKKAKLFVNTSKYEGFPNTFIQAAMHGTPVISLNINPDNIFNKYKIGFFANDDLQKMEDDMKEILNSEDEYKKVSDAAYAYAVDNHDIKILAKNFLTLINKIN